MHSGGGSAVTKMLRYERMFPDDPKYSVVLFVSPAWYQYVNKVTISMNSFLWFVSFVS